MLKIVLKWFSKLRETSKFLLTNLQYKCCVMSAESVDSQQHAWAHATKWDGFVLPWHFTSCLKFCSYAELRHVIFRHSAGTWYLQCKFYTNKSSPPLNVLLTHRADRDELVRMIHHRDQEIEKHDDVDDGEASKHDQAPEPCKLLDPRQLKVVQVYEAKWRPE